MPEYGRAINNLGLDTAINTIHRIGGDGGIRLEVNISQELLSRGDHSFRCRSVKRFPHPVVGRGERRGRLDFQQ